MLLLALSGNVNLLLDSLATLNQNTQAVGNLMSGNVLAVQSLDNIAGRLELIGQNLQNSIGQLIALSLLGSSTLLSLDSLLIQSLNLLVAESNNLFEINLSNYPSGIYAIRITTGDGIIMKKIAKK